MPARAGDRDSLRRHLGDLLRLLRDVPGAHRIFLREEYDRFGGRMLALAGWYRRRWLEHTRIVAVVGSLGKTTTMRALRAALACPERGFSYSNYGASLAENLLRVRPRDAHAVLEVGVSRPGQMASYARRIQPDAVVVTSIASDHHRSFPTLADTREEKLKMIRGLGTDRVVFLNGDDPNVLWMASQTRARVITFGSGAGNDVRATALREFDDGSAFEVHGLGATRSVRTRFAGEHMTLPALAALDVFARRRAARKIVVLGPVDDPPCSVGEAHREIGRRAGRFADLVVCIGGDSMRGIRTGAAESGLPRDAVHLVGQRIDAALDVLRTALRPGDAVLIKGREPQRLRRLVLALEGRRVGCEVAHCKVKVSSCDVCPLLDAPSQWRRNHFIARSLRA